MQTNETMRVNSRFSVGGYSISQCQESVLCFVTHCGLLSALPTLISFQFLSFILRVQRFFLANHAIIAKEEGLRDELFCLTA